MSLNRLEPIEADQDGKPAQALTCVECGAPTVVGSIFFECDDVITAITPSEKQGEPPEITTRPCGKHTCDAQGCRAEHLTRHEKEKAKAQAERAPHEQRTRTAG